MKKKNNKKVVIKMLEFKYSYHRKEISMHKENYLVRKVRSYWRCKMRKIRILQVSAGVTCRAQKFHLSARNCE